jgi:hypothetical protein
VAESVLVPSTLLPQQGATWETEDNHNIKATLTTGDETATLNLTIDDEGRLQKVTLERYGNQTETGAWAYIPFGMEVEGDSVFNGYTIPSRFWGGWWYGTEHYRESIQVSIEQVVFG